MMLLDVRSISLEYSGQRVLDSFSLQLQPGEVLTVLGPSGVGKSSLLKVLAGLQAPASGEVRLRGNSMRRPHHSVSLMFQRPALLPWLTLEQNVAFGLDFASAPTTSATQRQQRVDQAIAETGLTQARQRHPSQLSGGMAQRAALARSLVRQPDLLLLDEPFSALDEVTRSDMQQLFLRLVKSHGSAAILVTHDIDEALLVSDRIVLLGGQPGRILDQWSITLPQPREDYIRELVDTRVAILEMLKRARPAIAA